MNKLDIKILPMPTYVHEVLEFLNYLIVSDVLRANIELVKIRVQVDGKLLTQQKIEELSRKQLEKIIKEVADYDNKNQTPDFEIVKAELELSDGKGFEIDDKDLSVGESTVIYDLTRTNKWVAAYIELIRTRVKSGEEKYSKNKLMNMSIIDFMTLMFHTRKLMLQAIGSSNDEEDEGK